jgi:hypothetical protein
VADLSTLSAQDVGLFILDVVLQDGPIAHLKADLNLGEVNIHSNGLIKQIHAKILKLGFNQITHSIFSQLCPNYSDQPHAALDHIRQSGAGPDGQPVTSSVIEFYQRLMNASRPFPASVTPSSRSWIVAFYLPSVACTLRTRPPIAMMLHTNGSSCSSSFPPLRPLRTRFTRSKTLLACWLAKASSLWLMAGSRLVHTLAKPRPLSPSMLAEITSPVNAEAVAKKITLDARAKDPLCIP